MMIESFVYVVCRLAKVTGRHSFVPAVACRSLPTIGPVSTAKVNRFRVVRCCCLIGVMAAMAANISCEDRTDAAAADAGEEAKSTQKSYPDSFKEAYPEPENEQFPGTNYFPEGDAELQRLYERFRAKASWHFEDWFIRDFFTGKRGGYFVDVGAGHFGNGNNTYALEKALEWRGIAIDALERYRPDYETHRPMTKFFCNYVSDRSTGKKDFYVTNIPGMSSGVIKNPAGGGIEATIEVPEITLNQLLDGEGVKKIDFLSMDIEGAEPAALRGFDIKRFQPALVCIELTDRKSDKKEFVEGYFANNGYVKIELWSRIDRYNTYFAHESSLKGAQKQE